MSLLHVPSAQGGEERTAAEGQAAKHGALGQQVQALLANRCYRCHGPQQSREKADPAGGLSLSSRSDMLRGGDSGAAVVPGQPQESLLIAAVNWASLEMPPNSKLPPGEIELLTRWVRQGAPLDNRAHDESMDRTAFPLHERRQRHWAWKPLRDSSPPAVTDTMWPATAVDQFVLARLEAQDIHPAPAADRRTLARRLFFDLVGLPPTPAETSDFVNDPSPREAAVVRLADRLLDSPHFGERWARHWLDVMRYADTRGHEFDYPAPNAYQYRDYVIRALNADVPYDQFVSEHIAGDLLPQPRTHPTRKFNESVLGTGFWYLGDWVHSPTDIRRDETDRFDNAIDTLGRGFLGLTIACARCHDHKFDAISSRDYYALAGFLQSSAYRQVRFDSMLHNQAVARQLWQVRDAYVAAWRGAIVEFLLPGTGEITSRLDAANRNQEQEPAVVPPPVLAWLDELARAKDQPAHPWHIWSVLRNVRPAEFPDACASLREEARREVAARDAAWQACRVEFDLGTLTPDEWRQDGFVFGPGPTRIGDLLRQPDEMPRIATVSAARLDQTWPALKLTEGTEPDVGRLAGLRRPGRTLRSPNFTIQDGKLFLLARGAGQLQAVVASHRLIHGPLHGELYVEFDTKDEWDWVAIGLQRYAGLRAHLEITPRGRDPLALRLLVQGPRPPLHVVEAPPDWTSLLLDPVPASSAQLASNYGQACCRALTLWAEGRLADDRNGHVLATLADWMVSHPQLFGDAAMFQLRCRQIVAPLLEREQQLLAKVQTESRTAIAIWDGFAEDEYRLIRGNPDAPAERVPRRFLAATGESVAMDDQPGSGRLALARHMVDIHHTPLIARVIVNRVWHHMFGRGIVPTVDDFGVQGQPPSHPELLDFLALRFTEQGWSIKSLLRDIVRSRTYHMTSDITDPRAEQLDPDNGLLHRMRLRRLEGEVIRDSMLALSGRLDPTVEGRPVEVYLTPHMTGRGRPEVSGPLDGDGRRSLYTRVRKNFLPPMMLAFDLPIPAQPVGRRNVSNVPAQALVMMNDPFVHEQVALWQQRVAAAAPAGPEARIMLSYEMALGRPPCGDELAVALDFLQRQADALQLPAGAWKSDPRVWTDLGHVIWNLKEFIFVR